VKFKDIDRLDWEILNALSDDYESVEQIKGLIEGFSEINISTDDLIARLEKLHKQNYIFLILNKTFDRSKLIQELETPDRKYWFGRTETGYLAWRALIE